MPGKHFLIETEDEAVDEPDVEVIGKKMENRIFICKGEGTNCIQDREEPDDFKCLNGASCERKERNHDTECLTAWCEEYGNGKGWGF